MSIFSCVDLVIGVSFSVTCLFRVCSDFWFGLFLLLNCRNSIYILGIFRSLIQVELILCECWEVRINFCLFFSFFYFQHSWHFIFCHLFLLLNTTIYLYLYFIANSMLFSLKKKLLLNYNYNTIEKLLWYKVWYLMLGGIRLNLLSFDICTVIKPSR